MTRYEKFHLKAELFKHVEWFLNAFSEGLGVKGMALCLLGITHCGCIVTVTV